MTKKAEEGVKAILKLMTNTQVRNLMEHMANDTPMLINSYILENYSKISRGKLKH